MQHKHIVIIGGGPIGLVTALNLAKNGHDVVVLDANFLSSNEGRVLALSYASYYYLNKLGVWPHDLATPINQVHISHNGLGTSNILASDINLDHLGYTVKYTDMCNALMNKLNDYPQIQLIKSKVNQIIAGKNFATINYVEQDESIYLTTNLAIVAEGGKLNISGIDYTSFDYGQTAIVTQLKTQKSHQDIAFERFDVRGAMVLLPYRNNYVFIWTLASTDARAIVENNILLEELAKIPFMKRLGKYSIIDKIHSFALNLQVAKTRVVDRVVVLGNSAQILHPVSAQGMNLGLRDAQALNEIVDNSWDPNDLDKLALYNDLRVADAGYTTKFTHYLARFVEEQSPLVKHLRGIGIIGLSNCKSLQNRITNSLIFGI